MAWSASGAGTSCSWLRHSLPVSLDAAAQQSRKLPRVGYLALNNEATGGHILIAFRQTMQELGWVDGQNIIVETRFADGEVGRLPTLVDDLIHLKVDVIVVGSSATTRAAKSATTTIPIVMLASVDAVGEGFVASLARPGRNVTGLTLLAGPEIASKQLELLREIAPTATRVAVLINPLNGSHAAFAAELTTAARRLGTQLQLVEAGSPTSARRCLRRHGKAASYGNSRAVRRDVPRRATKNRRPRSQGRTSGDVQSEGIYRCGGIGFVRSEPHRYEPPRGETSRQDPARR